MKTNLFAPLVVLILSSTVWAGSVPTRAGKGMVVSQNATASQIGVDVLRAGGNAVDGAVATAFALAVVHPAAGNIGGGGFLVFRPDRGEPVAYDFREMAPAQASPKMWLIDGKYNFQRHHHSHLAVGVPGTVAGLHLAWREHGNLPWKRLVEPAIALARDGFVVSDSLARSLKGVLPRMKKYPASLAQFSHNGVPFEAGELLKQPDLARTLSRIAQRGPNGFYRGETAELLEKEMRANGGIITKEDLKAYVAKKRPVVRGTYREVEILSMPPPSSGGVTLIAMLNTLEGYDLAKHGPGAARNLHLYCEAMRRAFADRALHLGDPEFNPHMPIQRLISKEYAQQQRKTIRTDRASKSIPNSFQWKAESRETTHFSIVDEGRNAVSMTYTLENSYGSAIVAPGTGFLLNNEMGDFNAGPGLTTTEGLIGTKPNLAQPGKRMLSSMTPTIVAKNGKVLMVTGSPGGRTIINTVMQTIVNVVDYKMNAQEAVDAGRIHHQWLPDRLFYERYQFSPDTLEKLRNLGHPLSIRSGQGVAQVIVVDQQTDTLQGGSDRRVADGAAVGY